ncbi:flagellar protein FlgN [Aciduricibacillus chroicocephali]|uniref:Flagellar protein FlgN n=1 Tax=Aciduricibacillus chroicocephali TaxID=3054939 RepID=A0ABY9KT26_9BACI|nr:flagellar protein FlgN [Bacillaceae bacterium 44XB]
MSLQEMIGTMDELSDVHDELIATSDEKAQTIINNDIPALQQVLIKERKLVQKLQQSEKRRTEATERYATERGLPEVTVTAILDSLDSETDQQKFEKAAVKLTEKLAELKSKEQASRALVEQSMQFIQYSLNLLSPSINTMNYGSGKDKKSGNRSVFDSKA